MLVSRLNDDVHVGAVVGGWIGFGLHAVGKRVQRLQSAGALRVSTLLLYNKKQKTQPPSIINYKTMATATPPPQPKQLNQ